MRIRIFLLLSMAFLLSGCTSTSKKPSQLRIGQFLFTKDSVEVSFKKHGELISKHNLSYGDLTNYSEIESAVYDVEVSLNNALLLKKKMGIGTGGVYTLIINGIPQKDMKTNQKTNNMKLHEIVEGEEAIYANGNLPQMRILNDEFECGKKESKIRWVHLSPGVEEISAKAYSEKSKTTSLSALTYPKISKDFAVNLHQQEVKWELKGSKVQVSKRSIPIEDQYLYTCFLLPDEGKYLDSLKVVIGETRKKGF